MSTNNAPTRSPNVVTRLVVIAIAVTMISSGTASAQNPFQRDNSPIVVALDGIHGRLLQLLPALNQRRTEPYLGNELGKAWDVDVCSFSATRTCSITTIPWSGLLRGAELDTYVMQTRDVIRRLALRHPERPFVIVAHSWGSVAAYQALIELGRELDSQGKRIIASKAIMALITLGSPLETPTRSVRLACNKVWLALKALPGRVSGQEYVLGTNLQKPDVVNYWINYWIEEDCVSYFKLNADRNVRLSMPRGTNDPHGAYYRPHEHLTNWIGPDLETVIESSCVNLLTSNIIVPAGFGAAFDVLQGGAHDPVVPRKGLMVGVTCAGDNIRFDEKVEVELGLGSQRQLVYSLGYLWLRNESKWEPLEFKGPERQEAWLVGSASASLPLKASDIDVTEYVAAYVCTWYDDQWKCGCRDADCATPYWQLQAFRSR